MSASVIRNRPSIQSLPSMGRTSALPETTNSHGNTTYVSDTDHLASDPAVHEHHTRPTDHPASQLQRRPPQPSPRRLSQSGAHTGPATTAHPQYRRPVPGELSPRGDNESCSRHEHPVYTPWRQAGECPEERHAKEGPEPSVRRANSPRRASLKIRSWTLCMTETV